MFLEIYEFSEKKCNFNKIPFSVENSEISKNMIFEENMGLESSKYFFFVRVATHLNQELFGAENVP